jgi:hypothetical protein
VVILKESPRDWLLVGVVAFLVLATNLPERWTDFLSIDRRYLLAGLIGFVAVALIRYLKFALLLVVVLLAVGANLPDEIAREFNVDRQVAVLGLVVMVVISLSNKLLNLPTGLEKSGRTNTARGVVHRHSQGPYRRRAVARQPGRERQRAHHQRQDAVDGGVF